MLVMIIHKILSQILTLIAIPVYRTWTGNNLAKRDDKIEV